MRNIAHPKFGGRNHDAEPSEATDPHEEYQPFHDYVIAAGSIVVLMQGR